MVILVVDRFEWGRKRKWWERWVGGFKAFEGWRSRMEALRAGFDTLLKYLDGRTHDVLPRTSRCGP